MSGGSDEGESVIESICIFDICVLSDQENIKLLESRKGIQRNQEEN